MNFDAKLTKEQEELMEELMLSFKSMGGSRRMMHVDPNTGRSSYFPFDGCIALSGEGPDMSRITRIIAQQSFPKGLSDEEKRDHQHKMAMQYLDNYRPRRRGQR
jgi:hypothetical protein